MLASCTSVIAGTSRAALRSHQVNFLHGCTDVECVCGEDLLHVSRLCSEDRLADALECLRSIEQGKKKTSIPRDTIYHLLQACTRKKDLFAARHVHSLMTKSGLDTVSVLADHLIRLFTSCGSLLDAEEVFDKAPKPTVYTWNSLLSAHAKLGRVEKVLELYEDMQVDGITPDKVTFLCILKACGTLRAIDHGRLAHYQLLVGEPDILSGVGNMLVDMYAKCGHIEEGRKVFDGLGVRDVVSWGALMIGYAHEGLNNTVLDYFEQMYRHDVKPNKVVFLSVLKSCAGISTIRQGFLAHYLIVDNEVFIDTAMASALVDMYAKCGLMMEAHQMFDGLTDKDVKAWGALMSGYSAFGSCSMVEWCFKNMTALGVKPDDAIFTSILACYSHAGLSHQGYAHFQSMIDYGIKPNTEHYNCMADLLGRVGCLKEAKSLLEKAPNRSNLVGWLSLLTSCKTYTNPCIGRQCFKKVMELEPTEARGYMLMSNIYANASMWQEVERVQELRRKARAWRKPGISTIEVDNRVYDFFVGAKTNPQTNDIYHRLGAVHKLIKKEGYVPQMEVVIELVAGPERSLDRCA